MTELINGEMCYMVIVNYGRASRGVPNANLVKIFDITNEHLHQPRDE